MTFYVYETIDAQGKRDAGIVNASGREEAEQKLKSKELSILRLRKIENMDSQAGSMLNKTIRSETEKRLAKLLIGKAATEQSLKQLAALLEGGVPILNAFRIVAEQAPTLLGRAYSCACVKLMEGGRLTDILKSEMPFLGEEAIGMIAAGEANGDIDSMCRYAAELMFKRRQVRGSIIQAMAYPAIVVVVASGVVVFLIRNVIPRIMKFLEGRSGRLPAITQALVNITNFVENNWIWLLATPIALGTLFFLLQRNSSAAPRVDYALLRLPLVGKALSSSADALWTRTLGILLGSGIGIIEALTFTENSQTNRYYRQELNLVRQLVSRGHPLSTAVKASGLRKLEPMSESMIMVGENTGRLDEGLNKVADFSEQILGTRIGLLSKLIEPALFMVVGGIVGFVYIAFFLGLMAASTGR